MLMRKTRLLRDRQRGRTGEEPRTLGRTVGME